jgi:tetratricopeptide (TPR) repeat protein
VDAAKWAAVEHDMRQGYVLTEYFYQQMILFEKDPASLKDTIGEMVYSMDVEGQVSRAKQIEFDKEADEDVLQRSKPRQLTGLDLAEAKLAAGDVETARAMAQKVLAAQSDTITPTAVEGADAARAHFIMARVDLMSVRPNETEDDVEKTMDDAVSQFQKTIATSKDQRLLSWSHIYLGRMLDLECKRDEALAEYKEALASRDGRLDTRLAAERGIKSAYVQRGHEKDCEEDNADSNPAGPGASQPGPQATQGKPAPQ